MKLICCCVSRNRGTGSKTDGSSFLHHALDSYVKTVHAATHLIIINDSSNDDTEAVLSKWHPKRLGNQLPGLRPDSSCTHINSDVHRGIGGSMNYYVLPIMEPDDIIVRFDDDIKFLCPGWGQRVLDSFAKNPELVSLGGRQIDPRGFVICFGDRLIGARYRHLHERAHPDSMKPLESDPAFLFPVQSVMGAFGAFRASALKEIGGYDPRFAKLRCETEDVHVSFIERGWQTAVRFGLDIVHWSDPTLEHASTDKKWGVENLNEEWFAKWKFHRTGLDDLNGFDPLLAAARVKQLLNHPCENIRKRLNDFDFDEVPGMVGAYSLCRLPVPMPPGGLPQHFMA